MMKLAIYVIGIALAGSLIAGAASAAQSKLACLNECQADIKQRGLSGAYPYGYCRNKCSYWAPAEKDRSRSVKQD